MQSSNPIKTLLFEKWQGAGNDFILIDDPDFDPTLVKELCNRRYGIGADGLIWFQPPDRMRFYNCDGGEVDCCGNALRCLAKAKNLKSINGKHRVQGTAISMGIPKVLGQNFVDSGVPHLVVFDGDFANAPALRMRYDANVNFVEVVAQDRVRARTFERGVEGETLACGTGAVAISAVMGKDLYVEFHETLHVFFDDGEYWLDGPAECVFSAQFLKDHSL